jgi:hypothetical protein
MEIEPSEGTVSVPAESAQEGTVEAVGVSVPSAEKVKEENIKPVMLGGQLFVRNSIQET